MGYIEDAIDEVKRATPTTGVNVCIYDDFEDVGDKLETIGNFNTVEEAQEFIDNYEGDAELVMYESEGVVDVVEEKLNKNGTGIQRATRGVNPEKTKAKVLEFVYVSKSECDICKQYDGKTFATDSPNRPVIPRLESQGDEGSRPYTHPNCKCKWVRPFSYAGITNSETKGSEDYDSVTASLYKYAHNVYGNKFDNLPKSRKHYILMKELMRQLKSDESFDPTSLPIASMLKMTYDAIQPTLALQLAKMKHHHTNEVRDLIDTMVGESLTSERKHRIVTEHNLDFTFENLLELTTLALFEAYSDEHDVWDEETNMLVDPSLLEDKPYMPNTYNIDPYPHRHEFIDNVCAICNYVLKSNEVDPCWKGYKQVGMKDKDGRQVPNCVPESKATENENYTMYDLTDLFRIHHWTKEDGEMIFNEQVKVCDICGFDESMFDADDLQGMINHVNSVHNANVHPITGNSQLGEWWMNESKATEGGRGSGRKGHQKWMLGGEADPIECPNCMVYTEKKDGNCQICGNSY